jgi:rRNA maturation endonuclease Nob1
MKKESWIPNKNEQGNDLNEIAKKSLNEIKLILEAMKIPEEERSPYTEKFIAKVQGIDDADLIDLTMANISSNIVKRSKELKEQKKNTENFESTCNKCGRTIHAKDAKFCQDCGNELEKKPKEGLCSKCGGLTMGGDNFCRSCGEKL